MTVQVCIQWEAAANAAPSDVRTVILRTGIVLAREGGALAKMLPIFQIFAGRRTAYISAYISFAHLLWTILFVTFLFSSHQLLNTAMP
jgi:NAD dependent epimerase/dehydratase family enzyme